MYFGDSLITQHCINSTSKTYDGDQWVRVEALVLGDSVIKHITNGDTVMTYRRPEMGGGSLTLLRQHYERHGAQHFELEALEAALAEFIERQPT